MESHWHFKIMGFEIEEEKIVKDFSYIFVIADSEDEALNKAKKVIKCLYYRAVEASECFEIHGVQSDMGILQLEIQKQLLNLAKGRN